MLNAWHLPVAPFVKQHNDKLTITLWLSGENPPSRVTLRSEFDNEEISLAMRKQRRQPQPGVTAWRATLNIALGQPRRRYSFKLLWHDRQLWFTPQGFSRFPPARLEQFAVDVPDSGPQWVADQIFYQIFPDRFARSQSREAGQDRVYYHHAAGQEIVLRDWDDPLTPQAGGSTFYGGCLNGICEKLPYLKKLGVTALYLNPVFTAPGCHISNNCACLINSTAMILRALKLCWVKTRRACRWRWSGCLPGPACHVFITAMKSAWTAQMTPCAANRSHGMNASRTATCWRCTSVWRNCARAVWRCVVADARRCMPKVT